MFMLERPLSHYWTSPLNVHTVNIRLLHPRRESIFEELEVELDTDVAVRDVLASRHRDAPVKNHLGNGWKVSKQEKTYFDYK